MQKSKRENLVQQIDTKSPRTEVCTNPASHFQGGDETNKAVEVGWPSHDLASRHSIVCLRSLGFGLEKDGIREISAAVYIYSD